MTRYIVVTRPMPKPPRSMLDAGRWTLSGAPAYELHLIPQTLLVPMRPHSLAALMLGNFCFPSFLERAHSDFQSRRLRFNHLIRRIATALSIRSEEHCLHLARALDTLHRG